MKIHISRDGHAYGPYTVEEVRHYLETGHLIPQDLAWHEGLREWTSLESMIGGGRGIAAPDAAGPLAEPPREAEVAYHHVSPLKFTLLSICSLGLYALFWFFKNWKFVRRRDASNIRPFWRAVFSPLWCYALCMDVAGGGGGFTPRSALAVALSYFVLSVLWRLPDPYWLLSFLSFVPLLCVVRQIDRLNRLRGAKSVYYRKFGVRHIALCVVGGAVLGFATLSSLNILPSTQVTAGDRLPKRDLEFLRENHIVNDSERIHFFYSAGLLSIKSDGNLVTDQRVISYYHDADEDRLVVESARYGEIRDVRVKYSQLPFEDTEIEIVTGDDEGFNLYVSAEDRRDRLFVNKLTDLWRSGRGTEK
jgi:hypothetical protein